MKVNTQIPGWQQEWADDWDAADLDRCEHGRHSIDTCWGCGYWSTGNLYLAQYLANGGMRQLWPGGWVRIGTDLRGRAIVVNPQRPNSRTEGPSGG